ncbi:hypothetical protein Q8F55_001116 [Vanrija albida]|uniref:Uncharacterized protein n=1 Tax=Vanrija albida TaxID=181172 RepID=A0ABR3QFN0_9TREE
MATHAPPPPHHHSSTAPIAQLYSSSFTYSLNSPDPSSLSPSPSSLAPSSSSHHQPQPSSKAGFRSSRRATRAVSYVPVSPNVDFTLSPPLGTPPSPLPPATDAKVLASPDPQRRVPTARRSIQFSKFGQLNWSRPIVPDEPVPAVPPLHPLQAAAAKLNGPSKPIVQIPARSRPNPAIDTVMRTAVPQQSPGSLNSSDDEQLPVTPPTTSSLPAGAAPPEIQAAKMWAVPHTDGLRGLGIAELEVPAIVTTRPLSTSSSESAGSLAGESVATASSSASSSSQPVPRKKVPTVTDSEIKASAANSPRRRPAVRHSLIVAPVSAGSGSSENVFTIAVAEPAPAPASDESEEEDDEPSFPLKSSFFKASGSPNMNAAAARRPFYAQGKAAMSAIDFSPRVSSPAGGAFPPFQKTPRNTSAQAVPTLATIEPLKIDKRDKRATMLPPARTATTTDIAPPMPMQPAEPPSPERTLSVKASTGFLGKHKKLSRFLGKA